MVAVVVALALPVSQLRAVAIFESCCCPDPAYCQCPDHAPESSSQPAMRACDTSERVVVAPQLPAFHAPAIVVAAAPAVVAIVLDHAIVAPHEAPPPTRPDAPS